MIQSIPIIPLSHPGYPDSCKSCGLYTKSHYYKAAPTLISNRNEGKVIVVITHFTDPSGSYANPSEDPSRFLKAACCEIPNPVIITSAILCEPDFGLKGKELSNTYRQCNQHFKQLLNSIPISDVGAIICVGNAPFKALFPDSRLTVGQAEKAVHYLDMSSQSGALPGYGQSDVKIPTLVMPDPSVHMSFRAVGGKDLRPVYMETLTFAKRIASGEYQKPVINWEVVEMESDQDLYMAKEWFARSHYKYSTEISFDTEVSMHPDNPRKITAHHPDSKIICYVLEYVNQLGESNAVVFRTRNLSKRAIFELIVGQFFHSPEGPPIIDGSNLQFDFTTLICHSSDNWNIRVETAFWFFNALAGHPTSLAQSVWKYIEPFDDSFLWNFSYDNGALGNGLKSLYCKYTKEPDYSVVLEEYKKQHGIKDYADIPVDMLEEYAAKDGHAEGCVMEVERPKIDANYPVGSHEYHQKKFYLIKKWEMIASTILSIIGIPVNYEYFHRQNVEQTNTVAQLQHFVDTSPLAWYTGRVDAKGNPRPELNVKSANQMSCLIDNILKHYPWLNHDDAFSKTPSGLWQMNDLAMSRLQKVEGHIGEVFQTIEKLRELRDLVSKHISMPLHYAIPGPTRHHIHPNFKIARSEFSQSSTAQTISGTGEAEGVGHGGRWASEPNVQNIPARINPEIVRTVREGYVAIDDGHYLVNGDLKTIEPVVKAWLANCAKAKGIFMSGVRNPKDPAGDWYLGVGSVFFEKQPGEISKAERNIIKNKVLLPIDYGQHPCVLADVIPGITVEKATQLYREYFYKHFPEFHIFYAETRERVLKGLPVHNAVGGTKFFHLQKQYNYDREKHFWMLPYELSSELRITPADDHEIRAAGNLTVQGSASTINNAGQINLTRLQLIHPKFRAIRQHNTVHDALVYSIPKDNWQYWVSVIATVLYSPTLLQQLGLDVFGFTEEENPLRGEFKMGDNYFDGNMREVEYQILPEIIELFKR